MDDISLTSEQAQIGTVIDYRNGVKLKITELREDGTAAYEAEAHEAITTAVRILIKIAGTPLALMQLIQVILYLAQELPLMTLYTFAGLLWEQCPWQCQLVAMRSQTGPFNEATFPSTAVTFPATEEVVNVKRDENGFIESATKLRLPVRS